MPNGWEILEEEQRLEALRSEHAPGEDTPTDQQPEQTSEQDPIPDAKPAPDYSGVGGYTWGDLEQMGETNTDPASDQPSAIDQEEERNRPLKDAIQRERQLEADMTSAEINGTALNIGKRAGGVAAAVAGTRETAEQEQRRKRDAEHNLLTILAAMQNDLDNHFVNMSDDEFDEYVAFVEAETGMPYEEYAKTILGDKLPDRESWMSERDYQRELARQVQAEVLDDNNKIKPQYRDDPTAQHFGQNANFQAAANAINAVRQAPPGSPEREDAVANLHEQAQSGYGAGEATKVQIRRSDGGTTDQVLEEVAESSVNTQDTGRDGLQRTVTASSNMAGIESLIQSSHGPVTPTFNSAAAGQVSAPSPTTPQPELASTSPALDGPMA